MQSNVRAVLLCSTLLFGCEQASDTRASRKEPKPDSSMAALAPGDSYEGKTLEEWGIEYVRWYYAQTSCDDPVYDDDGSLCALYQDPDSPMFFFARAPFSTARASVVRRTECHVPADKALFVPVAAFFNDNAGVVPPLSDAEVEQSVIDAKESMRSMVLKADGVEVEDLEDRGVGVVSFSYRVPPAPNWYACSDQDVVDTTVEPSYLGGYFAVFTPPEPGEHELEYASVLTYDSMNLAFHVRSSFVVDSADD